MASQVSINLASGGPATLPRAVCANAFSPRLKPITSSPEVFKKSRRLLTFHLHLPRRALDSFQNSRVGSATAEVSVHCRSDLGIRRLRSFREEFRCLDDHSVVAVSALHCLFINH